MLMMILLFLLGIIIGSIIIYVILNPKVKSTQMLDEETRIKNETLRNELVELSKDHSSLIAKKEEILKNIEML